MNIVMIGSFAFQPKGTVSARAFPIARALVKRGHRVTILMPPYDNLQDSGRAWEQDGVRLQNMRMRRNDAWHQATVPIRMARFATRLQPDIIHVFKPIGYSGLAGMVLCCVTRRPLVLDTDDWEGRGGWRDVNPYPALWRRLFDWQERWLARHVDAVTVASRTLQTQVWGFGVDPACVVYVPNGPDQALRGCQVTDAQKAAIRAHLAVGDAPLALYLGQIPYGTDLDLAIDAFARVCEQLPGARLVIAGAGDGLSGLQDYAERVGMSGRVLFPGWIERDQAHLYLASADVIVNPYRDTLINRAKCAGKLVAAMAMGKAVVTTRVGQNLEYIQDGHSGVLTPPGDVAGLARALLGLLSDREWAVQLGQNARKCIWAEFDWDKQVGEVERSYRLAVERAGDSAPCSVRR